MKLTEQQIADNAAAVAAFLSKKPIQAINLEYTQYGYQPAPNPCWDFTQFAYRPAPLPDPPKPWDCADDVPGPVCWIRICGEHRLVIAIDADGLTIGCNLTGQTNTHIAWVEFGQQIAKWEHSTDRKEWKPCVKEAK